MKIFGNHSGNFLFFDITVWCYSCWLRDHIANTHLGARKLLERLRQQTPSWSPGKKDLFFGIRVFDISCRIGQMAEYIKESDYTSSFNLFSGWVKFSSSIYWSRSLPKGLSVPIASRHSLRTGRIITSTSLLDLFNNEFPNEFNVCLYFVNYSLKKLGTRAI